MIWPVYGVDVHVKRLRPTPSTERLIELYPTPHDHRLYGRGHHERVEATIALAAEWLPTPLVSIADLSCGNGEIAVRLCPSGERHLGDIAMLPAELDANGLKYFGPIEQTISLLDEVQAFVCSETLEHLEEPWYVLAQIRRHAEHLVLSTPLECWDDGNAEHLWAWNQPGVEHLLGMAGWSMRAFTTVDARVYDETYLYGIWVCQ